MITGYNQRQRFKKKLLICAAAIYAVVGIYTFGLMWNRIGDGSDESAGRSFLAGIFWPLTISAIAQEDGR